MDNPLEVIDSNFLRRQKRQDLVVYHRTRAERVVIGADEFIPEQRELYLLGQSAIKGAAWFAPAEYSPAPTEFKFQVTNQAKDEGLTDRFLQAVHGHYFAGREQARTFVTVRRGDESLMKLFSGLGYDIAYGAATHWVMTRRGRNP